MRRIIKPFTVEVRGSRRQPAATRSSWSAPVDGPSTRRRDPELEALFAPGPQPVDPLDAAAAKLAPAYGPEVSAGRKGRILPALTPPEPQGAPPDEPAPVVAVSVKELLEPKPKPRLQRLAAPVEKLSKTKRRSQATAALAEPAAEKGGAGPSQAFASDTEGPMAARRDRAPVQEAAVASTVKSRPKFQTRGDKWKRRLGKWAR